MSKIFAIFPIDKSSNTTFLNRIHTFLTSNLESDWHCYKVHFSNEEHEDCIKQSSGSRFIFFMGHGGETKLHGACAVYGEMSVDVAASSENTNFFNKEVFIDASNYNPQNEMFSSRKTKCSKSKTKCLRFRHPPKPYKK